MLQKKAVAKQYFSTIISTDVLLKMKIFSSSPYATFNSKEWNSLSKANHKFSDAPIKIKKRYFSYPNNIKSSKIAQENNDLPKQIQLAFS